MNSKVDPSDSSLSKQLKRKLQCVQHGETYVLRCAHEQCSQPLICSVHDCLSSHFHVQGKLIAERFQYSQYTKKFSQFQRILTCQDFSSQAKQLKAYVDDLKLTMVSIYKDYKELHSRKELHFNELKMNTPLDLNMLTQMQRTLAINRNMQNSIIKIKQRLNIHEHESSLPASQKDDNGSKTSSIAQSPILSSKQDKMMILENSSYKRNKGSPKEYENGQIANSKEKIVPIDLQISPDQNVIERSEQPPQPKLITESKVPESNSKTTAEKDISFDDLFDNNSSKNKPNQSIELGEVISAERLATFRSFLQNMNTTEGKNLSNSLGNRSNSPHRNQNSDNEGFVENLNTKTSSKPENSLKIYERDFLLKNELTSFLEKRIKGFKWSNAKQIFSSAMPSKSIENFHQLLQDRRSLLFVFVGDHRVVGSFYPAKYPKLQGRIRNDPNSFLFASNDEKSKIFEYRAVPSEFHLSVSEKLHICHGNTPSYADGIRTIQRNMNELNFYLPSVSYKYVPDGDDKEKGGQVKTLSGSLKVKEFFILQVEPSLVELN